MMLALRRLEMTLGRTSENCYCYCYCIARFQDAEDEGGGRDETESTVSSMMGWRSSMWRRGLEATVLDVFSRGRMKA